MNEESDGDEENSYIMILQKGEVCKGILFTLLDANIPLTTS